MHTYPEMAHIRLAFEGPELDDPIGELNRLLAGKRALIPAGAKIGIAVGSRGIHRIDQVVAAVARFIERSRAHPVVLPAMGSHGGATAEGQKAVLAAYGITESSVGAPILATMDTVLLGRTAKGHPVYFDRIAAELDGLVLVNRVKPHTDFHDTYESGVVKQAVIGLGNHTGAQYIHTFGLQGLKELIPEAAQLILAQTNILLGIAIIENARDTIAEFHLLERTEITAREPVLLQRAKALMPSLPFGRIDLLVIEHMGKNISGVGLDSNITGRTFIRQDPAGDANFIGRIVCLDLTPESHGNALGMGMADVITRRLYDKIDFQTTYANVITSGFLERGFVPIVQDTDAAAIETALIACGRRVGAEDAGIVQIADTLHLEEMLVSVPLLDRITPHAKWETLRRTDYAFSPAGGLLTRLTPSG